ncbi:alpha/beta hydrolase [Saccharopolyspora rhizosphaerae]|uniref:Alpha/beta hydrolase n=1 Tax=Saccharopolyspora rhizosphaerae TaxID=2492662 RepID=A0A3R8P170_9PSEU|nr:alpha/beta hydrolase [Saccharopolyspora rhizosphaerae]RRO14177.1 alpha/beta hydrolase [Saccharopolyspora rhizosphaerae]
MVSWQARLVLAQYWLTRRKQVFADPEKLRESAESHQAESVQVPNWVHRRFRVEASDVHGHRCYTLHPRRPENTQHILYLHGGAYVHQVETAHWRFLARLIEATGSVVTVPIYPLAPTSAYDETLAMVWQTYQQVLSRLPPQDQVVMGDSAGGGLALFVAQRIKQHGGPQPRRLVLFAPWLDLTTSDPRIDELEPHDPFLSAPGLREAARLYTRDLDLRDHRISPLFGDLSGLAPMSVFTGTRDVLLADSRRLRDRLRESGSEIDYEEYTGMFHGWVLQSLPEAEHARNRVSALVGD